jgi:hypothetical protein
VAWLRPNTNIFGEHLREIWEYFSQIMWLMFIVITPCALFMIVCDLTFYSLMVTWCINGFIIQQLYALPTLCICVLYLSENKQRYLSATYRLNGSVL